MNASHTRIENIRFGGPGTYKIQANGRLSPMSEDCLDRMQVSVIEIGDQRYLTELVGALEDQAALSGVLNTLYESHMTILSVERLEWTGQSGTGE